ncbi:CreD [Colletotrichum higginsianum IMI 349063]|uniref:CreD n=1 Tax=Colletotrichum higginsianum (strain IMI 349063) TaxID=759273 RepID=A0A1B7YWJ0_COLHI|nr:CreD [Colletotrichum higginsianum IMI 349063]OBR16334.1 CreD [Colletotrichum higginsianum IMI 349063]
MSLASGGNQIPSSRSSIVMMRQTTLLRTSLYRNIKILFKDEHSPRKPAWNTLAPMLSFLSRLVGAEGNAHISIRSELRIILILYDPLADHLYHVGRTEKDFVILRGPPEEATEQPLQGTVRLRLPAGHKVLGVRLCMNGFLRHTEHDADSSTPDSYRTISVFEQESPPFLIDHGHRIVSEDEPDLETFEWPFVLIVPGDVPETFQGCGRCSITYRLGATTIRNSSSASPPQTYRTIRINRALSNSAFTLMDPVTIEGTWSDTLRYSVSIAHRAVALGTTIPLEMSVTALKEGVEVLRARCRLSESHEVTGGRHRLAAFTGDRQVAEWAISIQSRDRKEDHQVQKMTQNLPLPKEPKRCSPDVAALGIQTSHVLHVDVTVRQPEGRTSSYRVTLPVILFISPQLPIDGSETFVWPEDMTGTNDVTLQNGVLDIPPIYGAHLEDKVLDTLSP